jgi:hypothetical protein
MPEAGGPGPLLDELPEAQATGELRRIYTDIRQLSGVPMVALIYRHLATIPGALEWAWSLLQPAMRAGAVQQRAWQLAQAAGIARQPALPAAALRAVGIGEAEQRLIARVLDAYNRANPVNIMAVRCLSLHLAVRVDEAAGEAWPEWEPPAPIPLLPAMVDPAAMTPVVRELALLLANRAPGGTPSPLWPSLYRHLAHWPAFLGYASVLVLPEFDAIDSAAARLRSEVDAAAASLARRLKPSPELEAPSGAQARRLQSAIDQFSARIPEMVVIGNVLRRALPAAPDA